MKHIAMRALSLLLIASMLLPAPAHAVESVAARLSDIIATQYPDGSVFNDSFDGGVSCFGFAKLIVNKLFGSNADGRIRSWNYAGESTSGMLVLSRLSCGEYSAEQVRALMAKAKPGCVIQRNVDGNGASQHTMIFLSAGETSFRIYDCNAHYDNVVHIREITYNAWETRTFLNVTLLIPDNYPEGEFSPTPTPTPSAPAKTEAEITSRLNGMMASSFPLGESYTSGISSDAENILFTQDVLKALFSQEHRWSLLGEPLEHMKLVDRRFYGEYDDTKKLSTLFLQGSPGDVIQLGTGTHDRAHAMIFLSADTESVWVYDADRSDDGIIRKRNLPYATRFANGTWQNISLLRADTHPRAAETAEETSAPKPEEISFVDVPTSHWAYAYIQQLVADGIVRGKDPAHFAPDDTVTRAEFLVLLSRMTDSTKLGTGSTEIRDVPSDAWYLSAVRWANSLGIARGDEKGYFYPSAPITREDLSVMLVRFLTVCSCAPSGTQNADRFYDRAAISSYARSAVDALSAAGILSGKREGFFVPKDHATRAECAKILWKSALLLKKS